MDVLLEIVGVMAAGGNGSGGPIDQVQDAGGEGRRFDEGEGLAI